MDRNLQSPISARSTGTQQLGLPHSRYCMSYSGYSGKKEDLLEITVKTKVACNRVRESLESLIAKQF